MFESLSVANRPQEPADSRELEPRNARGSRNGGVVEYDPAAAFEAGAGVIYPEESNQVISGMIQGRYDAGRRPGDLL